MISDVGKQAHTRGVFMTAGHRHGSPYEALLHDLGLLHSSALSL